jgi:hypothetical protein
MMSAWKVGSVSSSTLGELRSPESWGQVIYCHFLLWPAGLARVVGLYEPAYQFSSVSNVEKKKELTDISLNGALRQSEVLSNLGISEPLTKKKQHFSMPCA